MSAIALGHYFRSFLVKLNMLESQLGPLTPNGTFLLLFSGDYQVYLKTDDASFAIVLELKDEKVPSAPRPKVGIQTPPDVV
jgi:mitotic spindle assembly checkpoint protein MAD2B